MVIALNSLAGRERESIHVREGERWRKKRCMGEGGSRVNMISNGKREKKENMKEK